MELTTHNFLKYAADNYHNPHFFTDDEFNSDLNKIVVLKKLLRRYSTAGKINERLVLNNIIVLLNVFGIPATNRILFFRIDEEHHSILKTFLLFLNSYRSTPDTDYIPIDDKVLDLLRGI